MNKNLIVQVASSLGKEDTNSFLVEMEKQNKEKKWSLGIVNVELKNGILHHNSGKIKEIIDSGISTLKEKLAETTDVEEVILLKKHFSSLVTAITGERIQYTSPFDKLKKDFTESENALKKVIKEDLTQKIDELQEETYNIAKSAIKVELEMLKTESEANIDLKIFDDFCELKKKTKNMLPSEKTGKLGAAAKKQIKEQFDLVAIPLLKQIEVQKIIQKEQNLLAKQLSEIKTVGLNEELEESKVKLSQLIEQINLYYSNISDTATSQIYATINIVEANMRANKNTAKLLEEKDKEQEKALEEQRIRSIFENAWGQMGMTLEEVTDKIAEFENYDYSVFGGFVKFATNIASKQIDTLYRIKYAIEQKEKKEKQQEISHGKIEEEKIADEKLQKFKLSNMDMQFISKLKVEAVSESEAKERMLGLIKSHFSMSVLEKDI